MKSTPAVCIWYIFDVFYILYFEQYDWLENKRTLLVQKLPQMLLKKKNLSHCINFFLLFIQKFYYVVIGENVV